MTSKAVPSVLASSVCWSLQCLISALTQGSGGGHFFRLTCSVALWGGREGCCKQITLSCACSVSPAGLAPARSAHSSGSRLLHRGPSEASPGLHAPPRSKPLRLRHSGSPQRRRLCWACVLCPSQVREAQVFGKCGHCDLSPLQSLLLSSLGVQLAHLLRRMMTVQNPKKS